MRRRTKPRVVWLPPTNANSLGAAATAGYQIFVLDLAGVTGSFVVGEIPLTIDAQSDPLAPESSLADVENSGYRLRRIVGKIFVVCLQNVENTPASAIVTAGIIVRRAEESTGASLAALDTTGETSSPGEIRNYGDPWIWRRSWLLANNTATGAPTGQLPESNLEYGSAVDGPHVDQKTARIVSSEERLFLNVSATRSDGGAGELVTQFAVTTDLRVLASMRTSSGNRRNASR